MAIIERINQSKSRKFSARRTPSLVLGTGIAMTLLLSACGDSAENDQEIQDNGQASAGEPVRGGTLTWGSRSEPENGGLDPFVASVFRGTAYLAQTYETLVTQDANGEFQAALATEWEQEDDRTFRFTIREDVQFEDGSDMTVDDVIWSFEHHREVKGDGDLALANLESIEEVEDHVIEIRFTEPTPGFLNLISRKTGSYFVVNREWYENADDTERETRTSGTGPFTVDDWVQGSEVSLVANEHYWEEGVPYLDGIDFPITNGDEGALLAMVQQNQVDAAWFWNNELALQAQDSGFEMGEEFQTAVRYFWIDPEYGDGALEDERVRQAMSLAIDRQELIELGMGGIGVPSFATPPVHADVAQPDESTPFYSYDPDAARDLLEEAGVEDLEITLTYGDVTTDVGSLELVADQLSEVGITLNLEGVPYSEVQNVFTSGADFPSEMIYVLSSTSPDPAIEFHSWLDDDGLVSRWQDQADADTAKELLASIDETADESERIALIDELNNEVAEKGLTLIPYATPLTYQVWSNNVNGFETDSEDARHNLKYTWLNDGE